MEDILIDVSKVAHSFKLPAFSEEKEVRIICRIPDDDSLVNAVQLRSRGDRLIPYVVLEPNLSKKLPIKTVRMGPAFKSFGQNYALQLHLKRHGFDGVEIQPSRFTLR